jgi:hypothetical protein
MQQADLTLREAFEIIKNTRQAALNLFPDKESAFDLIYAPRFRRIIRERFVIAGGGSAALTFLNQSGLLFYHVGAPVCTVRTATAVKRPPHKLRCIPSEWAS